MASGRPRPKLTKLASDDSTLNRVQDHLIQTLNPALGNPVLALSSFPKGSLVVGTGANTVTTVSAGTNGQVLTADSTVTAGVKWAASGSGASSLSTLHTTTPRRYALWNTQFSAANVFAVCCEAPTVWGSGGRTLQNGTDRVYLQFTFPAGTGQNGGYYSTNSHCYPTGNPKLSTRVRLQTLVGGGFSIQLWNGAGSTTFQNTYTPTIGGTNADTGVFVSISLDPRVGTNWLMGSGNGTTAQWVDMGIAAATGVDFLLTIESSDNGATYKGTITNCGTSASAGVTRSSFLPATGQALSMAFGCSSLASGSLTASLGPWAEYLYLEFN